MQRLKILFVSFWLLFLMSCGSNKAEFSSKPYTIFLVLAPIEDPNNATDTTQWDLASKVVGYVKKDLVLVGNSFQIKGICNKGQLSPIATTNYSDATLKSEAIIPRGQIEDWLLNTRTDKCTDSPKTLASLINLVDSYLKNLKSSKSTEIDNQVVLIVQAPWTGLDQKTLKELQQEINKIKGNERISKVYLFGVTTNEIPNIFHELEPKAKVSSSNLDTGSARNSIEQIRTLMAPKQQ
ncbi:MAG: hypothetical protein HWQ35_12720 [Nostoc sp. NMS1]|uniref:hypothetical protein n=1 Tax=unclassified Nostoc TaxID=2593658 RepID=UPI0025CC12C9|nr:MULTISPECIES: hypothetical protein [unclassified Nostoc]MBN3907385.1 hypothetical protein [Nostoc sp. NMS1]MBN3991953.1 hypothetical protein [Nostoc sp. NMS2]